MLNESIPPGDGKCKSCRRRYGVASEQEDVVQYAEVTAKKDSSFLPKKGQMLLSSIMMHQTLVV